PGGGRGDGEARARREHRPRSRAGAGGQPRADHRAFGRGPRVHRGFPEPFMTPLSEIGTLVELVTRAAELWPDRTAWIFDETGERFTFAEVDRLSTGQANKLLELGVKPGDRVAVMLRNKPAFPLLWLSLAKIGAILVPVNTNYREFDGAHVLRHSGARFAVVADE